MLCGIDLAWNGNNNTSAMAFGQLHGNVLMVLEFIPAISGMGNLLEAISSKPGLEGIAIDASLIVTNESGQRTCERELARAYGAKGASCHATNLRLYPAPFSVALSKRLEEQGYSHLSKDGKWQIECYPHPAIIEMFGLQKRLKYKKGAVAEKRRGQIELADHIRLLRFSHVLRLHIPAHYETYQSAAFIQELRGTRLKQNEDCLDSIICLYIAGLYSISADHRIFGDTKEGYVYVPTQKCI